ncbi:MAG: tyrosine-type recombinase/integrase [Moorellales bacterium]
MPGSITRRGSAWYIRYDLPRDPITGKRRQRCETVHGSRKDAERRLREILVQLDQGRWCEPASMTLGEYLEQWFLDKYVPGKATNTVAVARRLLRKYVIGAEIGTVPLPKVSPWMIDRVVVEMVRAGKAPRTVKFVYDLLRSALNEAVRLRVIPSNPALAVRPPQVRYREIMPLSAEEKQRLLEAAKGDRFEEFFILLLATGLRPGEALALTWDDVDFENHTLTVRSSGAADTWDPANSRRGPRTKTEGSRRTVPLLPSAVAALRRQRRKQAAEKLRAGELYEDRNLVFATEDGRPVNLKNLRRRHWRLILKRAGLPEDTRLYVLRHTFATMLLRQGEDVKRVAAWLGHRDAGFTYRVYHHYLPEKLDEAERLRLEAVLFGGEVKDRRPPRDGAN